jgi:hypothetical protein
MPWFERNPIGRPLFPHERQFVAELKQLLSEIAAPQVDESETALTGEGTHCLIVLIPHRALGGISIVVWLFKDRAEVTWAQVADLDCCHDSLDLGISVSHFRLHGNQPDFGAVLECIRRQFSEPLTFRVFDDNSATVLIRDHSRYWRSPHWSYEAGYVFEIAANTALRQQLFSQNRLAKLEGTAVARSRGEARGLVSDAVAKRMELWQRG